MNILVMAITYNCAEIVPFFVRHYAQFATKIVCFDDHSTDGTREILAAQPIVSLRDWPYESGINEELFQKFWQEEYPKARGEFDWVFIVDPDELIIPKAPYSMPVILDIAREHSWDVVSSIGYNLTSTSGMPKDDGKSQLYKLNPAGVRAPVYNKPVVFRPEIQINWSRGRHTLENCSPSVSPPMLKLLHARFMGEDYTRKRNAQNYERVNDKGVAWTCAPTYDAPHLEHSPLWSSFAHSVSFNVLEDQI